MNSKKLSEILSALQSEFNKSNVATDLVSAQWNKIYNEHSQLNGFTPSKVRIVTANVTLPVAIDDCSNEQVRDAGINVKDILNALNTEPALAERKRFAALVFDNLQKKGGISLSDRALPNRLMSIVLDLKKEKINADIHLDVGKIVILQKEFLKYPATESGIKCFYKTADLEKFKSDNIIKLNFSISVSL